MIVVILSSRVTRVHSSQHGESVLCDFRRSALLLRAILSTIPVQSSPGVRPGALPRPIPSLGGKWSRSCSYWSNISAPYSHLVTFLSSPKSFYTCARFGPAGFRLHISCFEEPTVNQFNNVCIWIDDPANSLLLGWLTPTSRAIIRRGTRGCTCTGMDWNVPVRVVVCYPRNLSNTAFPRLLLSPLSKVAPSEPPRYSNRIGLGPTLFKHQVCGVQWHDYATFSRLFGKQSR